MQPETAGAHHNIGHELTKTIEPENGHQEHAMIKDILVCLEGSSSTERATELGIELAREHGARLVGLAIVDGPDTRAGAATGTGGSAFKQHRPEGLAGDAQKKAEGYLEQFRTRSEAAGVVTRILELRGRPAAKILEEMQEHDLTLIGRSVNFLFETKAEDAETRDDILHRARRPVIVVPEEPARAGHDVLVAFDGSSAAKRAVAALASTGLAQGRTVHVGSMDDDGQQAWEMATRGVELLRELSIAAKPRSIVSALPIADAILELRRKLGAGLLVTGAYTRSRLSEMIWGSVTRGLIEKTPVPLFLHH
jgi:nucleotide-binding universal stress UspA family protein